MQDGNQPGARRTQKEVGIPHMLPSEGALVVLSVVTHADAASNAEGVADNGTGNVLAAVQDLQQLDIGQGRDDVGTVGGGSQFGDVIACVW